MKLSDLFGKQSQLKTPLLIKVGVVAGIWILASGLLMHLDPSWQSLAPVLIIFAQMAALVAIWNLRKWGVYATAFFGAIGIAIMYLLATGPVSAKVLIAAIIFRLIPLVPALIYWKKFKD